MSPMDTPTKRTWLSRGITLALAAAVASGTVLTLVAFLGRWSWAGDLVANFRVHLFAGGAAVMLLCLALRRWKLAAAAAAATLINLGTIAPLYVPHGAEPPNDGATLRLMHLNVYLKNRQPDRVAESMRESGADVIFLQEGMEDHWIAVLAGRTGDYELVTRGSYFGPRGIAMWARRGEGSWGVRVVESREVALVPRYPSTTSIEAIVDVGGTEVALLNIHPPPPTRPHKKAFRDEQLAAAAAWAAAQKRPCVVIGDFNATPWTHAFRHLLREGGLVNSQLGYGVSATWQNENVGFAGWLPIDHALHSPDLVTLDRRVGEYVGSDHRAVHVTLAVPRGSTSRTAAVSP